MTPQRLKEFQLQRAIGRLEVLLKRAADARDQLSVLVKELSDKEPSDKDVSGKHESLALEEVDCDAKLAYAQATLASLQLGYEVLNAAQASVNSLTELDNMAWNDYNSFCG